MALAAVDSGAPLWRADLTGAVPPPIGALPKGGHLLAAIDIGTNSIHMVVATVDPVVRSFSIVLTEKTTARLGDRDPDSGELTAAAMDRALQALRHCRDVADSHGIGTVVAVATSATREAPNGRDFLRRVQQQTGIDVGLVDGAEEARLIYLGVLSAMDFAGHPHLIIDIGGGSSELVLADSQDARALSSVRIGAVRLYRDFVRADPIPPARVAFLRAFIQGMLEPTVEKTLRRVSTTDLPLRLVGTSGTVMSVAALIAARRGTKPARMNGFHFSLGELKDLMDELLAMDPRQRRSLEGLSERRAEIIVPGGLILQTAMELLGLEQLTVCERALREGLVVDWMLRNGIITDRFSYQSSVRRRTVLHQARKYRVDAERAERVAGHALTLFDATRGQLHDFGDTARELLWGAALLHTCGRHISASAYHKHSWYLIRHSSLLGYCEEEHLTLAALARYHRSSLPKKRHSSWQSLRLSSQRLAVERLSPLLRLAVALDRRPQPVIAGLMVAATQSSLSLELQPRQPDQDLSLEVWSLKEVFPTVEQALGICVELRLAKAVEAR